MLDALGGIGKIILGVVGIAGLLVLCFVSYKETEERPIASVSSDMWMEVFKDRFFTNLIKIGAVVAIIEIILASVFSAVKWVFDFIVSILPWIAGIGGLSAIGVIYGKMETKEKQLEDGQSFNHTPYYVAMGLVAMLALGIIGYSLFAEDDDAKTSTKSNNVVNEQISTDNNGRHPAQSEVEFSLGGMELGLTVDEMHKLLGKEKSIKENNGNKSYLYDSFIVVVNKGVVVAIIATDNEAKTGQGVHIGSDISEVIKNMAKIMLKTLMAFISIRSQLIMVKKALCVFM